MVWDTFKVHLVRKVPNSTDKIVNWQNYQRVGNRERGWTVWEQNGRSSFVKAARFFLFEAATYLFVVFVCDRTHVFVVVVATNVFVDAVRDRNFLITPWLWCVLGGDKVCPILVATNFVTFKWRQSLPQFGDSKACHILVATKFVTFWVATKFVPFWMVTKLVTFLVATKFVTFLVATKFVTFLVASKFVTFFGWRRSLSLSGGDKICVILVATKCVISPFGGDNVCHILGADKLCHM